MTCKNQKEKHVCTNAYHGRKGDDEKIKDEKEIICINTQLPTKTENYGKLEEIYICSIT